MTHPLEQSARNAEIMRLFEAGETLQAIGDRLGLTRERVRQIAARKGGKSRKKAITETVATRRFAIRAAVETGLTRKEAAEKYGVTYERAYNATSDMGRVTSLEDEIKKAKFIAAVHAGRSFREAAKRVGELPEWGWFAAKRLGLEARHGRWRDAFPW
jgi:hypothetical protein